ncbi:MAG: BlaI/MecI/CopY family transcriptional regulator [Phycisphaeraceae bacterium]|nr:BlaI/MecI/CopY family transcriptional regulator [Phycisphaeraceae bacterium]
MARIASEDLTRRERQIMDIIYRQGQCSVTEVLEQLPDPPSYSAVRALMRILEQKSHLRHHKDGIRYLYAPTRNTRQAARAAIKRLVHTYFDGSTERAIEAVVEAAQPAWSNAQKQRLAGLLRETGKA